MAQIKMVGSQRILVMRSIAFVALIGLSLAGCNSPSDEEVTACVKKKIDERTDYSMPRPIICNELIGIISAKTADYKIDESTSRVIADVRWRAKIEFGKSSYSASACFVSTDDNVSYYTVDEVIVSKFEVTFEKWASGWKCGK